MILVSKELRVELSRGNRLEIYEEYRIKPITIDYLIEKIIILVLHSTFQIAKNVFIVVSKNMKYPYGGF